MILAALLFIRRVAVTTTVSHVTSAFVESAREHAIHDKHIPDDVAIFKIVGPFLFGSTEKLASAVAHAGELPPVVILRLRYMSAIDATGLKAIQDLADRLHGSGRVLLVCGAPSQPSKLMQQAEFHRHLGDENILPNVSTALRRASELLAR
jgi:SulP family sulfate permease